MVSDSPVSWSEVFGQDAEIGCRCGTVPLLVQCWSGNLSKGAFLTQSAGINEIRLSSVKTDFVS